MPSNHVLLSLGRDRTTEKVGWHKRTGAYTDAYIDTIEETSRAPLTRVLTAIPSPFARLHLFDSAFAFSNGTVNNKPNHDGTSEYHRMVSECLDVLELLWSVEDQAREISLERWSAAANLPAMQRQAERAGQRLLAETLKLYLDEDGKAANFVLQPTFYMVVVDGEVLALSSPLTLFISAPGARELAARKQLIHQQRRTEYFSEIRPLHTRDDRFQLYIHTLFSDRRGAGGALDLRTLCRSMAQYVAASGDIVRQKESALGRAILNLQQGVGPGGVGQPSPVDGSPLLAGREPVTILGHTMLTAPSEVGARLANSPVAIRTQLPKHQARPPIVWAGSKTSHGETLTSAPELPNPLPPLADRILPDLGTRYPFVCASDFLQDTLVQLPFLPNTTQFYTPAYTGFEAEVSFLLPLKPAFFEFFKPSELPALATFRKLPGTDDGVVFELKIPTATHDLLFEKTYFKAPAMPKYGRIVDARMNLAIFPFLSVVKRPDLDGPYWTMLIDNERQPSLLEQTCFQVRYAQLDGGAVLPFLEGQRTAPRIADVYPRCDKRVEAGSTYTRLHKGPPDPTVAKQEQDRVSCRPDLITVECFPSNKGKSGTGVILPHWPEVHLGTRKAAIAIDFGTTNSHMAYRLDGEDPRPFQVGVNDLQVALLNDPNRPVKGGMADYDTFPNTLQGTGIRLHHEFVPSVIGPESQFHFPIRTATSEQNRPNLKVGEFRPLQNINISFIHGLEPTRTDERVETNLKWTLSDPMMTERAEAFIEELLLMMRTRLMMLGADPEQTSLTWFRPLSFTRYLQTEFGDIWKKKAAEVLRIQPECVANMTESEAPYYYHRYSRKFIRTSQPTVCIDIGGGSTDVVFFDGKGSGTQGVGRYLDETKNQRFLIQIIPKIDL